MLLREILSFSPRNVTAPSLAGIVADRKNDLVAAEKHFALAAKLARSLPKHATITARSYFRLSLKSEAAREFTASLAANPNQPSALINVAQFASTKIIDKSATMFEKAKAIQPDTEFAGATLFSLDLKETERASVTFKSICRRRKFDKSQCAKRDRFSVAKNGLVAEAIQNSKRLYP